MFSFLPDLARSPAAPSAMLVELLLATTALLRPCPACRGMTSPAPVGRRPLHMISTVDPRKDMEELVPIDVQVPQKNMPSRQTPLGSFSFGPPFHAAFYPSVMCRCCKTSWMRCGSCPG